MVGPFTLVFPVPIGAYDGSPAKTYLTSRVRIPEGGITYRIGLPLLKSDTLKTVSVSFDTESVGEATILITVENVTFEVPVKGGVEVGYEEGKWYIFHNGRREFREGEKPGEVLFLKIVPKGKVVLVGGSLSVRLDYSGEPVYRVRVGDILNTPEKYVGKRVLLVVSPGGWTCPVKRETPHPEDLSRSAMTVYDSTGCIYGSGTLIAGRILSPNIHPIYMPGEEKIVVVGRVKVDRKGVPYVIP